MNVAMVFAIIFVIIIMGFLFSLGFEQIISIFGISGQAQVQGSVKNIEKIAGEMYHLAEGSSNTYALSLPSGSRICFLKTADPSPNPARDWNPEQFIYDNLVADPASQYYGSNIWISLPNREEGYKIPNLEPAYNFCARSGANLYFENKGVFVGVEIL